MRIRNFSRIILLTLGRLLRRASLTAFQIAHSLADKNEDSYRQIVRSARYDMVQSADEPYYLEQYLRVMRPHLASLPSTPRIVDLGCGQGRFLLSLNKLFPQSQLYGCDLSPRALATATELNAQVSANAITLEEADIRSYVTKWEDDSIDLCLMTEVTIFMKDWIEVTEQIVRKLKPGGILAMSFRSQYFNGLLAARQREFTTLDTILKDRAGKLDAASQLEYTWQTSRELTKFFTDDLGVKILDLCGIGVSSGIPGDPHSSIARPSELDLGSQAMLMEFELAIGKHVPDAGRYIVVVAQKL
jgi:SAM-dependent methyltransferase